MHTELAVERYEFSCPTAPPARRSSTIYFR
jgi:hypothetical protein